MGAFGKGREVQFFMTEKDEEEFFEEIMKDKDIRFITSKFDASLDKHKLTEWKYPPKKDLFLIYNKEFLGLNGIDFQRSIKKEKVLVSGRIATLFSEYKYDKNENKLEIPKSKEFIKWWDEISKWIKKRYAKCMSISSLGSSRKNFVIYSGPDAVNSYNEGIVLSDFDPLSVKSIITYHPKGTSVEHAKKHSEKYVKEGNWF